MLRRVVSIIILSSFLSANISFASGMDFTTQKLAPPGTLSEFGQERYHKDIVLCEMALSMDIKRIAKLAQIKDETDPDKIKAAFKEVEDLSKRKALTKNAFQNPSDIEVYYEDIKPVVEGKHIFMIRLSVFPKNGKKKYYKFLFSTNPVEFLGLEIYPTAVCPEEKLDEVRRIVAAYDRLPEFHEADRKAIEAARGFAADKNMSERADGAAVSETNKAINSRMSFDAVFSEDRPDYAEAKRIYNLISAKAKKAADEVAKHYTKDGKTSAIDTQEEVSVTPLESRGQTICHRVIRIDEGTGDTTRVLVIYKSFIEGLVDLRRRLSVSGKAREDQEKVIDAIIEAAVWHEMGHSLEYLSGIMDTYSISKDKRLNETAKLLGLPEDSSWVEVAEVMADNCIGGKGNAAYVPRKAAYLFYKFVACNPGEFIDYLTGRVDEEKIIEKVDSYYRLNPHLAHIIMRGDNLAAVSKQVVNYYDTFFGVGTRWYLDNVANKHSAATAQGASERPEALSSPQILDEAVLPWNTPEFRKYMMVGKGPKYKKIFSQIDRAAENDIPSPILIHGPTGTGKELIMRAIQRLNAKRKDGPFIIVNVNDLPQDDADKLAVALFGKEGGEPGLFELANGGYIVFDELSNATNGLQGMLLRAIDSGLIRRIGAKRETQLDIRVMAMTNQDPNDKEIFRDDLIKRFRFKIDTADGLEREDAYLIAEYYNWLFSKQFGIAWRPLEKTAADTLWFYWEMEDKNVKNVRGIISTIEDLAAFSATSGFEEFVKDNPLSRYMITGEDVVRFLLEKRIKGCSDLASLIGMRKNRPYWIDDELFIVGEHAKVDRRFVPALASLRWVLLFEEKGILTYNELCGLLDSKDDYMLEIGVPVYDVLYQYSFINFPMAKREQIKSELKEKWEDISKMSFRVRVCTLPNGLPILYAKAIYDEFEKDRKEGKIFRAYSCFNNLIEEMRLSIGIPSRSKCRHEIGKIVVDKDDGSDLTVTIEDKEGKKWIIDYDRGARPADSSSEGESAKIIRGGTTADVAKAGDSMAVAPVKPNSASANQGTSERPPDDGTVAARMSGTGDETPADQAQAAPRELHRSFKHRGFTAEISIVSGFDRPDDIRRLEANIRELIDQSGPDLARLESVLTLRRARFARLLRVNPEQAPAFGSTELTIPREPFRTQPGDKPECVEGLTGDSTLYFIIDDNAYRVVHTASAVPGESVSFNIKNGLPKIGIAATCRVYRTKEADTKVVPQVIDELPELTTIVFIHGNVRVEVNGIVPLIDGSLTDGTIQMALETFLDKYAGDLGELAKAPSPQPFCTEESVEYRINSITASEDRCEFSITMADSSVEYLTGVMTRAPATAEAPAVAPATAVIPLAELMNSPVMQEFLYERPNKAGDIIGALFAKGFIDITDEGTLLVFSEKAAFGELIKKDGKEEYNPGLAPFIKKLALSGIKVAVVATTKTERDLIDELNKDIDNENKIGCAEKIGDIERVRNSKAAPRIRYYKVAGESFDGIDMFDVRQITFRQILQILGEVCGITDKTRLDELENLGRVFARMA